MGRVIGDLFPNTICFRVTRRCNLNCPFCLASTPHEDLDFWQITQAIDRLSQKGMKTIKLSGGEPSVRSDLDRILSYCADKELETFLYSNLCDISDMLIEELSMLDIVVKPSLHGIGDIHNQVVGAECFDRVAANLKKMHSRNISLNPRCTVNPINLEHYQEIIDFCIEEGIAQVNFCVFIPRERGYQNRERYSLTVEERNTFVHDIMYHRRRLQSVIEIKYKELWYEPYYVFEPDGFLWAEREFSNDDIRIEKII